MKFWLWVRWALADIRVAKWKAKYEVMKDRCDFHEERAKIYEQAWNTAVEQHHETLRRLIKR